VRADYPLDKIRRCQSVPSTQSRNRGSRQALAAADGPPKLICTDEPQNVDRVLELIRDINRTGTTVFMVEQNATLALQIADRGYVLQTGRIVLADAAPVCCRIRASVTPISAAKRAA
jgi:ABC-type branched-subunit amino acid transport system ATPase component